MDYEKKLEEAKKLYKTANADQRYVLESLFQEIRESDGEESKKWILEYLYDGLRKSDEQFKDQFKSAIAWLEKQGKQNPADITDKLKEEYRKGWDAAMQQLPKEVDSQIWQIANNAAKTWEESFAILCATQKAYNKGKKNALKEQKNSDWSEEDEKRISELKTFIAQCNGFNKANRQKAFNLIDTLRLQPKQEWGEEDEEMLNLIIAVFEVNHPNGYFKANELNDPNMRAVYTEEIVAWLKSLRPRNTWKPSDEQMKLLREVQQALLGKDCHNRFVNFMYELKRLREE